jgi:hypothetical protein
MKTKTECDCPLMGNEGRKIKWRTPLVPTKHAMTVHQTTVDKPYILHIGSNTRNIFLLYRKNVCLVFQTDYANLVGFHHVTIFDH